MIPSGGRCYINCSLIPNSQQNPFFNQCQCNDGFLYNQDRTKCVVNCAHIPNAVPD